jgi:hypothetical protein
MATLRIGRTKLSGIKEIESMPSGTRNAANQDNCSVLVAMPFLEHRRERLRASISLF